MFEVAEIVLISMVVISLAFAVILFCQRFKEDSTITKIEADHDLFDEL